MHVTLALILTCFSQALFILSDRQELCNASQRAEFELNNSFNGNILLAIKYQSKIKATTATDQVWALFQLW